ncbi:MAG TPA: PAS domain S-box protein [Ktedonobacterales bacterium]|nr:PAS domain S-box protein [Ktedonobacterales bacterium]
MNDIRVDLDGVRKQLVTRLNDGVAMALSFAMMWGTQLIALREPGRREEAWHAARPVLVFAAAYITAWSYLLIAAFLGDQPPPAPLFLPGAVLLCALLLAPPRRWWLYLAAAFLIQVPILAYLHLPLWWNVVGFIPDAVEPLIAVALMLRFISVPPRFASLRDVSVYTVCVVAAVVVAATLGSTVNAVLGGQPYWTSWRTWFLGDVLADLVLASAILLWIAAGYRGLRTRSRQRYVEAVLLYGSLLVMGVMVFDTRLTRLLGTETEPGYARALIYLPVPLLLWAAVRFGPRGITSALSLILVLAIPAVADAMGPFASRSIPAVATQANIFTLQLFLLVIGVSLLFLAAVVQDHARAEAALRASEDRYRSVVETQTELVSRFLPDTTLVFVNEANARFYGKSREEVIGTKWLDLVPPSAREPVRVHLQSLLEQPGIHTIEHEAVRPDGSVRWQQWVDCTICDADGKVIELQGIGRDITERKRMEQEMQASEARYRDLVETQTELICRYLPDGTLTFVNDSYCRHFGRSREALLGAKFPDLLPLAQAERAREGLSRLAAQPRVVTDEHEVVLPNGRIGWQQWVEHAIYGAGGQVIEVQAIGRDITERKRAEEALRASEERFRAAFESAAVGMMLVDSSGHAIRVNQPLTAMLGYSEEELRSLTFADITYSDDVDANLTLFRRALAGEIDSYQMEKRFIHRQGHLVWGLLSAGIVRDTAGEVIYLVGHLEDITSRKQLEREREEARAKAEQQAEQLDRLIEGMGEGVFVYDQQGQVVRTNAVARRLLGLDNVPLDYYHLPAEMRLALYAPLDGQEEAHLLTPENWLTARALRGDVLNGAEARDIRMRALDGRELEVSASVAPLHDQAGQVVGAVLILSDRTERNQLAREREEARANELAQREVIRHMDDFLIIAAHDLRSPLTATKLRVQIVARRIGRLIAANTEHDPRRSVAPDDPALDVDGLETAMHDANAGLMRLERLFNRLLDVPRIRTGTLELNPEPTDLAAILRHVVEEHRLLAPERLIELDLPNPEMPLATTADPDRIGQVITNFVTNALRYSPADQPVEVSGCLLQDEGVRVAVRDHGPGIPVRERERIWTRFGRLNTTQQRFDTDTGLGLGLYISNEIVKRHGGQIGVESEVGHGSTFWFILPDGAKSTAESDASRETAEIATELRADHIPPSPAP